MIAALISIPGAVSFVHLMHSVPPHIRVVKRWPFQEEATGERVVRPQSGSLM